MTLFLSFLLILLFWVIVSYKWKNTSSYLSQYATSCSPHSILHSVCKNIPKTNTNLTVFFNPLFKVLCNSQLKIISTCRNSTAAKNSKRLRKTLSIEKIKIYAILKKKFLFTLPPAKNGNPPILSEVTWRRDARWSWSWMAEQLCSFTVLFIVNLRDTNCTSEQQEAKLFTYRFIDRRILYLSFSHVQWLLKVLSGQGIIQ